MTTYKIEESDKDIRLDIALSNILKTSRSYVKFLINNNYAKVNGLVEKPSYKTQSGDTLEIVIPKTENVLKSDKTVPIIYKDKYFAIYNKPWGMSIHPNQSKKPRANIMLTDIISRDFPNTEKNIERMGIVHRLDKNTSGLIIVSLNNKFSESIKNQFRDRTVQKTYKTIVLGVIRPLKGTIKAPIARSDDSSGKMTITSENDGRTAETDYKVDEYLTDYKNQYSLLTVYPKTGRTHQIRVHLSSIGHPVVGDKLYGYDKQNAKRQLLHAENITFKDINNKTVSFSCPLPKDFIDFISSLKKVN